MKHSIVPGLVALAILGVTSVSWATSAVSPAGIMVDTTSDSDGDIITDGREQGIYRTNPSLKDTDGDGLDDFTEISRGLNPLTPNDPATTAAFVSWGYHDWHSPIPVTVSARQRSSILDIRYVLSDSNAATAEVRGFAAVNAEAATPYSALYPLVTMVEGTASKFGNGVPTGAGTNLLAWDAGADIGQSLTNLKVRLLARSAANLPLHFVTIPADTNGAAFPISRYQGTFSNAYERQMLLWLRIKGEAALSGGELVAVGGAYNGQQVTTGQVLNYPTGANWLAERLGLRLATATEVRRAQEAGRAGRIIQGPMYYVSGKLANEYGVETTTTNGWYFVKP